MPRQSEISKASGQDLINQTQDVWQESRETIPHQLRHELGQVLTELGSRITYTCQGQQPQRTKYSSLGGTELASHAFKTVQKAANLLPVESSRQMSWVITEMANRVRYTAEGEPQSQSQDNGEGFAEFEKKQVGQSERATVFA